MRRCRETRFGFQSPAPFGLQWLSPIALLLLSFIGSLLLPSIGLPLLSPIASFAADSVLELAPGVEQSVGPAVVRIGDSIHVAVTGPAGATLALPQLADTLGPFDVLGSEVRSAGGRPRLVVHLAAFDVGSLEIPSFDVPATGGAFSVRTRPYRITVESLLPADSAAADTMSIRAAHPPLELARKFLWKVALGYLLVILALGLLGWWLYRRWKNRPMTAPVILSEPVIVRPAELVALESLDLLMAKGYALSGLFKEHYTEAMDIVRLFIQGRLGIAAPDMTSYELLGELLLRGSSPKRLAEMSALLDEADLVKFARQTPTVESSVALVESARAWVRETHAEESAREAMSSPPTTDSPRSTTPTTTTPTADPPTADPPRSEKVAP